MRAQINIRKKGPFGVSKDERFNYSIIPKHIEDFFGCGPTVVKLFHGLESWFQWIEENIGADHFYHNVQKAEGSYLYKPGRSWEEERNITHCMHVLALKHLAVNYKSGAIYKAIEEENIFINEKGQERFYAVYNDKDAHIMRYYRNHRLLDEFAIASKGSKKQLAEFKIRYATPIVVQKNQPSSPRLRNQAHQGWEKGCDPTPILNDSSKTNKHINSNNVLLNELPSEKSSVNYVNNKTMKKVGLGKNPNPTLRRIPAGLTEEEYNNAINTARKEKQKKEKKLLQEQELQIILNTITPAQKRLLDYWTQNIIKHTPGANKWKEALLSIKRLLGGRAFRKKDLKLLYQDPAPFEKKKFTEDEILTVFKRYSAAYGDKDLQDGKFFKVSGLDEFVFSPHSKANRSIFLRYFLEQPKSVREKIDASHENTCKTPRETKKQKESLYPNVCKALHRMYGETHNGLCPKENTFAAAAEMIMDFREDNKKKIDFGHNIGFTHEFKFAYLVIKNALNNQFGDDWNVGHLTSEYTYKEVLPAYLKKEGFWKGRII